MKQDVPPEVPEAFTHYNPDLPAQSPGEISIEPLGGGLINHSFKICCAFIRDFFLQKINTSVFPRPELLQQNYLQLWRYASVEFTGQRMPNPLYWKKDTTLYTDKQGNYWRAFEFIENSACFAAPENTAMAGEVAAAFARFTAAFEGINTELLSPVIPGFHNLSCRYQQFQAALHTDQHERIAKAQQLINELTNRDRYVHFYESVTADAAFPLRVMHHDAKIANVLFHKSTGEVICPVDFDTVMPGYFFSDLGDMIRSMAGSEENNGSDNQLKPDYYEAIVNGYVSGMKSSLTGAELEHIHYAGLLMICMQTLRFLTDYLNGDTYYQISYPEHNFDRAANQFSLLQSLESYLQTKGVNC